MFFVFFYGFLLMVTPGMSLSSQDVPPQTGEASPASQIFTNSSFTHKTINAARNGDLAATVAAIGTSDHQTLLVDDQFVVTANLIIPANIRVLIADDGQIAPAAAIEVHIEGDFEAPRVPVFAGAGTITFGVHSPVSELFPEWWSGTDTQKVQAAINAAINSLRYGRTVRLSPRLYEIDTTLEVKNCYGFKLIGAGWASTTLRWRGNRTTPVLRLTDVHGGEFSDFRIFIPPDHPLPSAIHFYNDAEANIASPGHVNFNRLRLDGNNVMSKGFQFGGTGMQGNNDFHLLNQVVVLNPIDAAFSLENVPGIASIQVLSLIFNQCIAFGGKYGFTNAIGPPEKRGGGSFFWLGGEIAGATVADFYLSYLGAPSYVRGYTSEGGRMLLDTYAIASAPFAITFEHCRFSLLEDFPDGAAIVNVKYPGPVKISNCYFTARFTTTFRFQWNPGGQIGAPDDGRNFAVEDSFFQFKRINGEPPTMQSLFNQGSTLKLPTRWSGNWYQGDPDIPEDRYPRMMLPAHYTAGGVIQERATTVETYHAGYATTGYTPDPSRHSVIIMQLTGDIQINAPTNARSGQTLTFVFTQDATGDRNILFNQLFKKNFAPVTTASAVNTITFVCDGSLWHQVSTATGLR